MFELLNWLHNNAHGLRTMIDNEQRIVEGKASIMGCGKTDCWCHLEWECRHGGMARVFGGGEESFVDPYCYALHFVVRRREWFPRLRAWWTKQPVKRGLIEFVGVTKVMQSCQYRAMRQAVREAGWGILSTRVKGGQTRTIEICKRGTK